MGYEVKQSSDRQPLRFLLISSVDHVTGLTGATPTVTILRNGDAAFAPPSGAVSELGNGWYQVAGNALDTAKLGPLQLHATADGADPCDDEFEVIPRDPSLSPDATVAAPTARDALTAAIGAPARVSGDAGTVEHYPLPDLIAADKYLSGTSAKDNPRRGLRFNRLIPDGTVHRRGRHWHDR